MDPITFTFSPVKTPLPNPATPLEASLQHLCSLVPTCDGLTSTLSRAQAAHYQSSKNLLLLPGNTSNPTPELDEVDADSLIVQMCARELCKVRLAIGRLDRSKRGQVLKELIKEARNMKDDNGMSSRLVKMSMEISCDLELPTSTPTRPRNRPSLPSSTKSSPLPLSLSQIQSQSDVPPTPTHLFLAHQLIQPFTILHTLSEKHPAGDIEKYCEDLWWVERVTVQLERSEERVAEAILECVIARDEELRRAGEWEDV